MNYYMRFGILIFLLSITTLIGFTVGYKTPVDTLNAQYEQCDGWCFHFSDPGGRAGNVELLYFKNNTCICDNEQSGSMYEVNARKNK